MGGLILLVSLPVAVWGGIRVRRDGARFRHMWFYAIAMGFAALGLGWMSGYGIVGIVFFPVGAVVAILDSYFRVVEWFTHWF